MHKCELLCFALLARYEIRTCNIYVYFVAWSRHEHPGSGAGQRLNVILATEKLAIFDGKISKHCQTSSMRCETSERGWPANKNRVHWSVEAPQWVHDGSWRIQNPNGWSFQCKLSNIGQPIKSSGPSRQLNQLKQGPSSGWVSSINGFWGTGMSSLDISTCGVAAGCKPVVSLGGAWCALRKGQ